MRFLDRSFPNRVLTIFVAATLDVLRVVRDTLQSMLATGRQLASTPLQLELLGLSQALFK